MKIDITHKHFDKSNDKKSKNFKSIKTLAYDKVKKLEEYIPSHALKSASAKLLLDEMHNEARGYNFKAELKLTLPGKNLISTARGKTAEEVIDKAQERAARQIRKYKTKHSLKARLHRKRNQVKGVFSRSEAS